MTMPVLETGNPQDTLALGRRLGRLLHPGDVVALQGDLGAGKTAFTQGLAQGLGVTAPVRSPTFTLIGEYRTPAGYRLHHVDCYRLADAPLEMWDAGLTDLFEGDDVVVIEWAERISGLLPEEHLEIRIDYLSDQVRRFTFVPHGDRYAQVVSTLLKGEE